MKEMALLGAMVTAVHAQMTHQEELTHVNLVPCYASSIKHCLEKTDQTSAFRQGLKNNQFQAGFVQGFILSTFKCIFNLESDIKFESLGCQDTHQFEAFI